VCVQIAPVHDHIVPFPLFCDQMEVGRKAVLEMIADFLREAAVLLAVFMPLEIGIVSGQPLTIGWIAAILAVAGGLFLAGIVLERIR
jgi:hypothetical protein